MSKTFTICCKRRNCSVTKLFQTLGSIGSPLDFLVEIIDSLRVINLGLLSLGVTNCLNSTFKLTDFLPTTKKECELRGWDELDVILFSGDAYVDHPSFGSAILGRILEANGYRVAIVPQPDWHGDFRDSSGGKDGRKERTLQKRKWITYKKK